MKNGLDGTFWESFMQMCDLNVQGPSDFLTLECLKTLAQFWGYSSVLGHIVSGLGTRLLGFLALFDCLIGYNHRPIEPIAPVMRYGSRGSNKPTAFFDDRQA
jgi:hypothetical protein